MKTILQHINELRTEDWYYYFPISQNNLPDPFSTTTTSHYDFIEQYFQKSGKENVINDFNLPNTKNINSTHTNSVFFLGIILHNSPVFKNNINITVPKQNYNLFAFTWFLTVLFHDFGYEYENNFQNYKHIKDINILKNEFKIKYDLLKYKTINGVCNDLYKNIGRYFLYRRSCMKIDHGILAGIYLYDALIKNRIKQNKRVSNRLYFNKNLNKIYAQAAGVVATHNMWIASNNTKEIYAKFQLDNLIDKKPIKIHESPLLFLLGIIDTIDPVKIFSTTDSTCNSILNEISLSFDSKSISFIKVKGSQLNFNKMRDKANNFKNWLDVSTIISENKLTIEFNS